MSLVGSNIRRATDAGIRAAALAPFVHCELPVRWAVRAQLAGENTQAAWDLFAELEDRWRAKDAGIPQWRVR